jgi:hypothetical protein
MMQAGKYYVGDLCYVMHDQWDEFCAKTCGGNDIINGEITLQNGVKVATHSTAYGDGCYTDQHGREYGVDAGLIGCIRIDDINDSGAFTSGGQVIDFKYDFETSYDNGIIIFGDIKIDTDPSLRCEDDEYASDDEE